MQQISAEMGFLSGNSNSSAKESRPPSRGDDHFNGVSQALNKVCCRSFEEIFHLPQLRSKAANLRGYLIGPKSEGLSERGRGEFLFFTMLAIVL